MKLTPDTSSSRLERVAMMAYLSGFVLTTAVFIVSVLYQPPDAPTVTLCTLKNATGIDCPTCGLTRAFCALAKGEWVRALRFHPMSPAIFALFGWWWLRSLLYLVGKGRWVEPVEAWFPPLLTILVVTVGLLVGWALKLWLR
ncbi:MAG: hypothetical protein CFK52_11720 [Chloracidobacterium sp. CP2_5A]|nr:MAG: hypothetical protein CFK52_11720 [Chloracidobacterium sp. CP2_5A]